MCTRFNSKNSKVDRLNLNKIQTRGIHSTLRRTLLCSRVMGLLPLAGLTYKTSDKLRFTIRSPYTIYYGITLFGQVLMFISVCSYLAHNGFSMSTVTKCLFYTSSLFSLLILMTIGRHWPSLVSTAEELEKALPPFTRDVSIISTTTNMLMLTAAVVEHIFAMIYGIAVAQLCDSNKVAESYYKFNMPWIFDYTSFALWKALIADFFNLQSTFIWSYNDLLTIVINIYLTEHFLVHNTLLKKAIDMDEFICVEFRVQYMKIIRLVKLVNGQFGIYFLSAFGSNLYWICTQLFYSLIRRQTGHYIACKIMEEENLKNNLYGVEQIYFTYSFSFLVARTLLVLLYAARIHSNGIVPLSMLYNLPSSKYNLEVERYIAQIKNIKIAMSGMEFFHVTRTMILTLLGTIVTYELFLIQFNR